VRDLMALMENSGMASWLSAGGGTTMRGGVGILLEYVSFLCGKRRRGGGAAIEPIGGVGVCRVGGGLMEACRFAPRGR